MCTVQALISVSGTYVIMVSLETQFTKADSANLPDVNMFMVMDYFNSKKEYISAEMRGVKLHR